MAKGDDVTDYTTGTISPDAHGIAGLYSGIVSYQGQKYAIEVQSLTPGLFYGGSYVKFRGPPENLAGYSFDFDLALVLGIGISFSFSGGPAVGRANLGLGLDFGISRTTVTPLSPDEVDGGPNPLGQDAANAAQTAIGRAKFGQLMRFTPMSYTPGN